MIGEDVQNRRNRKPKKWIYRHPFASKKTAARIEGKDEFIYFTEKLIKHAQTEEEVLYPASILVGEYLKLKLILIDI